MGRNPETNQIMKAKRKEQIQTHALRLFATKGFSATKISDIARSANMSQGLVYHYYKNKDDIYTDLIRIAYDRMEAAALALAAMAAPPGEKLRQVAKEMIRNIERSRDSGYRFLLLSQAGASTTIPQTAREIIKAKGKIHYNVIEKIIEAGLEQGLVKPFNAGELSRMFWASINGLAISKAIHGPDFIPPDPEILMGMLFKEKP